MPTVDLGQGAPFVPFASPTKDAPRVRLDFLDGIRGLAALYVVFDHIYLAEYLRWNPYTDAGTVINPGLPHRLQQIIHLFQYGHYAVVMFIVLSGFSLMLPIARSSEETLKGGMLGYLKRRSLRILPPYYAALGVSLLLITLVPGLHKPDGGWWCFSLPAWTAGNLLSHLLLVHNLNGHWEYKIDAPLWSVASEWQIYFVFPLLLLPVWKRFGSLAALMAAFAISTALHKGLHGRIDCACPWFVASFTLGMAAAAVCFSSRKLETVLRQRIPWGVLSLVGALGFVKILRHPHWISGHAWQMDMAASLCAAMFLVFCTQCASAHSSPRVLWIVRLLEARWPQRLGMFSYSLYLTHFPVLGLMDLCFRSCHTTPIVHLMLMVFVAVPVCVLTAYGFYLAVERHFIPSRPGDKRQAARVTLKRLTFALSPAGFKSRASASA